MIRLFGLRDVLLVKRLQEESVALDVQRHILYPTIPSRSALVGLLTAHHLGPMTWVRDVPRGSPGVEGFVQVRTSLSGSDWYLTTVAPSLTKDADAESTWRDLLASLGQQAAEYRVLRILATVPEDSESERVLRCAGYLVSRRAEVFCLDHRPEPVRLPTGLYAAGSRDEWAVRELCRQVIPARVREAEISIPGQNDAFPGDSLTGGYVDGYAWSQRERLNAYFALHTAPRGYWLRILVRPECRADVMPHLQYILSNSHASRETPVYCPVPDYVVGVGWVLRALGFESVGRQVCLVQHVAERASTRRVVAVSGLEGSVDVRASVGNVHSSAAALARMDPDPARERLRTMWRIPLDVARDN